MSLETFGWGPQLAQAFSLLVESSPLPLVPGRVVRQARGLLTVQTAERTLLARTAGRLLHQSSSAESLPTVGDWVALQLPPGEGEGMLHAVLPRKSLLARREVGREREVQLIAANLDVVLLVAGLDGNFNPRRIERALTLAWTSGASPAVLLTKADLHDDADAVVEEVSALAPGVPVLALSSRTGEGLDAVRALIPEHRTGALLGSSGVGKSTLVNRLLGESRLATQEVRYEDDKGRHTTTHRELFRLPHGGLLIDGPGMRELGLLGEEEKAIEQAFTDILELAEGCRFRDCTHQREPGCAVRAAVQSGALPEERLSSFEKLQKEKAFQARQSSTALQKEQRRIDKSRSVQGWEITRAKRRRD
ncbi:ribosome small subunit-dependent GTPase A [Myxococcus faecalis]|uniref:ribosome small subunit-dependent GTPase A n=1 Tax=Myxococcus TaxID=32 RepID=UPI001CBD5AD5|nr:ribosome small subunit-dependent GTPase A [Myxococcus sp. AS-1-15]MBZ4413641.1 ribosome small subunit-dependent GTPase A [Myxococcus sp. XM-1-1-1]BDT33103.1 ribosome small subunit-dependent GTPase A [Myxococcus sp. MH1]